MLKSLKIPAAFLATGICWALFSDSVITYMISHQHLADIDTVRSINNLAFVFVISVVLYFEISKQQRKLSRSEEEYRQLFECNPNPMWIYNNESLRIIKVNDAAVHNYGYSRKEFLRMTINDIRPVDEQKKLLAYRNGIGLKKEQEGLRIAGTWKHIKGNGEIIDVSVVSHPVLFEEQSCKMVMATDMTSLLEKENKLQQSYKKIHSYNQILLQIAWSNSHELRKPLCSLIGLINVLKQSTTVKERNECIRMLEISSAQLDAIILKNNAKVSEIEPPESPTTAH